MPVELIFDDLTGQSTFVIEVTLLDIDFVKNPTIFSFYINDGVAPYKSIKSEEHCKENRYLQKTILHIPIPKGAKTAKIVPEPDAHYDVAQLRMRAGNIEAPKQYY